MRSIRPAMAAVRRGAEHARRQPADELGVAGGLPADGPPDGKRGEDAVEPVRGLLVAAEERQQAVPGRGVRAGAGHQRECERRLQHPALALLAYRAVGIDSAAYVRDQLGRGLAHLVRGDLVGPR
ncbi:hypothetical protein ACWD6R_09070 [Streptomyces sp. NPDC005151]